MKKTIVLFALICLIFSACTKEPMLYDVARETKLLSQTVLGNIYNIVQFKDMLFAVNGNVLSKDVNTLRTANASVWKNNVKPVVNNKKLQVVRVAVGDNGNALYVMTIENNTVDEDIPGTFCIHKAKFDEDGISGWIKIETPEKAVLREMISDGKNLYGILNFGTEDEHDRKDEAFLVNDASYAEEASFVSENDGYKGLGTDYPSRIQGVATCGDKPFFHITPFVVANNDNTIIYKVESGMVSYYSKDGLEWKDIPNSAFLMPVSLTYYEDVNDAKKLLVGCSSGYYEVLLNDDGTVPTDATKATPNNNYAVTFGTSRVISIFAPKTEGAGKASIYVGILKSDDESGSKYSGMWSYYPERDTIDEYGNRNGWNCE